MVVVVSVRKAEGGYGESAGCRIGQGQTDRVKVEGEVRCEDRQEAGCCSKVVTLKSNLGPKSDPRPASHWKLSPCRC